MIKVLLILGVAALARGYPTGAPSAQCVEMTPHHYGAQPKLTPPPFTISVSKSRYQPGEYIVVTLNATRPMEAKFRGFMLTARRADCVGPSEPVGKFSLVYPDPEVKVFSCGTGENNTVTHTSSSDKTFKSFLWRNTDGRDVYFKYTVVQNYTTYWTNIVSGTVYDGSMSEIYQSCADSDPIMVHNSHPVLMNSTMTQMHHYTTADPWPYRPASAAVKQNMSYFALLSFVTVLFL